jgi:hypothetical protein
MALAGTEPALCYYRANQWRQQEARTRHKSSGVHFDASIELSRGCTVRSGTVCSDRTSQFAAAKACVL